MENIIEKLSSYNIFNYLLPGVIFVLFCKQYADIDIVQDDLLVGFFLYYFIGLIISRVGSLVIEPIFQKFGLINLASYENYLKASKDDPKIDVLNEMSNVYRTLIALFIISLATLGYKHATSFCPLLERYSSFIGSTFLLILFIFSYSKQSRYITKRINKINNP